jgi:hypothetical protein
MDPHSWAALSHRLAACGQQSSIGPAAVISVAWYDFELTAAPPAAGRTATDSAVTSANMVRANVIFDARKYPADRQLWSSDDFASLLASAVFRRNLLYDPDHRLGARPCPRLSH